MKIVPSDIRAFIDANAGWARPDRPEPNPAGSLNAPQGAFVGCLLDATPEELITLTGQDLVQYIFAVEDMRRISETWSRNPSAGIGPRAELGNRHPLRVIRALLDKCPDVVPAPGTADLAFISDPDLRDALRQDISWTVSDLHNQSWKSATVLASSIVEALILWSLTAAEAKTTGTITRITGLVKPKDPALDKWDLAELIRGAEHLTLIGTSEKAVLDSTRGFRNLIHPGRAQRLQISAGRDTAHIAYGTVELLVRRIESKLGVLF